MHSPSTSNKESEGTSLLFSEKIKNFINVSRVFNRIRIWVNIFLIICIIGIARVCWQTYNLNLKANQQKLAENITLRLVAQALLERDTSTLTAPVLQAEVLAIFARPIEDDDMILSMSMRFRLYKKLYMKNFRNKSHMTEFEGKMLLQLDQILFPWIPENIDLDSLRRIDAEQEQGLVMSTNQQMFAMAVHAIQTVRHLNCSLPVEVFYNGPAELSPESIDFFNNMNDVKAIDLTEVFDLSLLKLRGWDIKPFIMLAASFRKVLLFDADAIFTKSPELFFEMPEYQTHKAMFFKDRYLMALKFNYAAWLKKIIPEPHSNRLQSLAMYKGKTNYEQESGVVLIDKGKHLFGLLAACRLNCPVEKAEVHSHTWGDKETFWMGFEIAEEEYQFANTRPGVIGVAERHKKTKAQFLCGHLAHFDKEDNLLWFNDGIVEDKRKKNFTAGRFLQQAIRDSAWTSLCIKSEKLAPLKQKRIIDELASLWVIDPLSSPTLNTTVTHP